jgi:aryl-phospho-beta-D-glucosidase BglC (GH1 family)
MRIGCIALFFLISFSAMAQSNASTVIFWEDNFPAADTAAPSHPALAVLPNSRFATAQELASLLPAPDTQLLVLPYGSSFPEAAWPAIYAYLQRGGNLLALGGRPFSRGAYQECDAQKKCAWKLRYPRNAWSKALYINDYTETPGSKGLQLLANDDLPAMNLPSISWARAWSPTVRLSAEGLYPRIGTAGTIDTRLDTIVWGISDSHKLAAPVIQLDHIKNNFVGGRWVMVPAELDGAPSPAVVTVLAQSALQGAQEMTVQPHWALFLPGETPSFEVRVDRFAVKPAALKLELSDVVEGGKPTTQTFALDIAQYPSFSTVQMPAPSQGGLHTVTARLLQGATLIAQYRTGYWVRDAKLLRSGPTVALDHDFFLIDGKPLPIVGTTYMASDVQRQYLMQPNPFVWDRDFAQMHENGINMIRTGLWTAWDQVMKEPGVIQDSALRNLEAFLMTARRYNIPVQFTFFAFIPDNFGGANPYLDPEAIRRQQDYMTAIVARFKDVPWLMWDLINEPSFDKTTHLWVTRANGDRFESQRWNDYLGQTHGTNEAVANAWNMTTLGSPVPTPSEEDFGPGSVYRGGHPLSVHDFYMFAQQQFTEWAQTMRRTIRATGSKQLVTVGQDEGGGTDRLNTSYWVDAVDFTTNHSWWLNDALLWDSLVAKQPGKPLLIQETGLQNDFQLDDTWRRSPDNQAYTLERKCAMALATSAGVIDWLWNVNAYMTEDVEVTIGIIRPDYTEKAETAIIRGLAKFANTNREAFRAPEQPQVAIVLGQDLQFSPLNPGAVAAQQKAVRVLHNYLHVAGYTVAENQLAHLGQPKLAILPSPHVLDESAWNQLLAYVSQGGTLLITGSFDRDPYWRYTSRMKNLGVDAQVLPLNFRQGTMMLDSGAVPVSFADQAFIDELRFADQSGWKELTVGKGTLLMASYPVELSEGNDATAAVYAAALRRAGVEPQYEAKQLSPGVLARPMVFQDSILYLFMSESGRDEAIDVRDKLSGAEIKFTLPEQRAALLLLNKKDGRVLAQYGY